jgi:hypothetical protein
VRNLGGESPRGDGDMVAFRPGTVDKLESREMSYEDPTRPLAGAQGSYRTLSSLGRSADAR